ncbi:hypothetical protein Tco_0720363 [Tanacetum coccineum]
MFRKPRTVIGVRSAEDMNSTITDSASKFEWLAEDMDRAIIDLASKFETMFNVDNVLISWIFLKKSKSRLNLISYANDMKLGGKTSKKNVGDKVLRFQKRLVDMELRSRERLSRSNECPKKRVTYYASAKNEDDEEGKTRTSIFLYSSQGKKIFQTKCLIKEMPHHNPYHIGWINNGLAIKVTMVCKISLTIGKYYKELVTYDVDMEACQLLPGRPWQHYVDATLRGQQSEWATQSPSKPLKPNQIIPDQASYSSPKGPQGSERAMKFQTAMRRQPSKQQSADFISEIYMTVRVDIERAPYPNRSDGSGRAHYINPKEDKTLDSIKRDTSLNRWTITNTYATSLSQELRSDVSKEY